MQNKLHTMVCHPERIEEYHFQISKFPYLQTLLLYIFYILFCIPAAAQPYQWDWKLSGGGSNGNTGEAQSNFDRTSEQIYDIKVGTDNNYYFLATVRGTFGVHLKDQPVSTYNYSKNNDIFLFSTTCDGTVRWSRAIGGGASDEAYNFVLDSNNNVYIAAKVDYFLNWPGQKNYPVYFSENDSVALPVTSWTIPFDYTIPYEMYKKAYLLKYDSNGNLVKKKAIESDPLTGNDFNQPSISKPYTPILYNLAIDSNDNIHFMGKFGRGNYLDNNFNVPVNYGYNSYTQKGLMQHRLIKCDRNLDYISDMVLPVKDSTDFAHPSVISFTYDETLNRYYIAGMQSANITHNVFTLTYGGKAFVERSFILAINGTDGSEVWRREIHTDKIGTLIAPNQITSLIVDPANSDVYIGGKIYQNYYAQNMPKIYDPHNPVTTTHTIQTTIKFNVPLVVKFNSSGTIQWVKTPTARTPNFTTDGPMNFKGFTFRYNEIAFGGSDAYYAWDSFSTNRTQFYWADAVLLRFNKQTGTTVGMDVIPGYGDESNSILAVAADNDGNYITGGIFFNGIFRNSNNNDLADLVGTLYTDFFVAKLAASACGTAVSTGRFNKLNVTVYPNPTNDILNIEAQETLHNYEVYNVLGQQIQKNNFNGNNQINLHGVTAGTYFIKITTTQGSVATEKVVKK
ncbi:T9SS type A sorting domain-containing protein [Paenimyroides viscosum]|uniref:T9SS C-terminal target domain-containing protein n=1 Tax=Paenimyroides viscosum TaxID=2488729 RepID=A0A3P1B066_9FLAO|nr:T9SS type A sorting domain-containing protein [Paenimyroides viscosum]RRA94561.1 T9SS C-terminal target domain-containing protein [Paenimyroides viscosum]